MNWQFLLVIITKLQKNKKIYIFILLVLLMLYVIPLSMATEVDSIFQLNYSDTSSKLNSTFLENNTDENNNASNNHNSNNSYFLTNKKFPKKQSSFENNLTFESVENNVIFEFVENTYTSKFVENTSAFKSVENTYTFKNYSLLLSNKQNFGKNFTSLPSDNIESNMVNLNDHGYSSVENDLNIDIIALMLSISMGNILIYFIWSGVLVLFPIKRIETDYKEIEKYKLYVMVPSLNEKNVVENTIHRFFKTYNANYRLIVIDDGSNDGTDEILKKIALQYNNLHVITRTFPNARKGKGEALNEGLRYIKNLEDEDTEKVIIGVLDADAHIKNQDYIKILSTFNGNPDLSMIQTSVGMNTVNKWLHRMQDIEFQSCITLISNVRNYLGNAAGGGNGQFFRLSSFNNKEEIWGNSLLEDFEISTRILLEGKKTYFLDDIVVYQEPVGKIKPLIIQRTRWAQGGIECIPKYGKLIIKSPNIRNWAKFEMFFYLNLPFITSIGVLSHIISVFYNLYIIFVLNNPANIVLIIMLSISIIISFIFGTIYGLRTEYGAFKGFLAGATIPFYSILMVPASFRSIIRFLAGNRKWEKTEHVIQVKV